MRSKALRVEASLYPGNAVGTAPIAEQAKKLEDLGFDRAYTAETSRDGFFPLIVAAHETERIELGTGIAVAFARNPTNVGLSQPSLDAQMAVLGTD